MIKLFGLSVEQVVEAANFTAATRTNEQERKKGSPHTPLKERKKNIIYGPTREGAQARLRIRARTRAERKRAGEQLDLVSYLAGEYSPPPARTDPVRAAFDAWWAEYPRKIRKRAALAAYTRVSTSTPVEVIYSGLQRYKRWWADQRTEPQYIPHPATWLNGESWTDELPVGRPRLALVSSSPAPTPSRYADPVELRVEARRRVTAEGLELDTIDGQQRYRELVAELAGVQT